MTLRRNMGKAHKDFNEPLVDDKVKWFLRDCLYISAQ
jgi:hypothetical protein